MDLLSDIPGLVACPGPKPCRACSHPRAADGRMAVAMTTVRSLRRGAGGGCITCRLFSSAINAFAGQFGEKAEEFEESRVTFEFQMSYLGDNLALSVIYAQLRMSFFAYTRTPLLQQLLPDLPIGQSIPGDTGSDASIEWVKKQLHQCTISHEPCWAREGEAKSVPSRILDIGTAGEDTIRLLEQSSLREPYACLSYCWGRASFTSTTLSNLNNHLKAIPWEILPLTFQQVIVFLRKLRIRYLWIDSLCIVQDDSDDWQREALQMASIYQNAHIVVSAAKSVNPHEGLFTTVDNTYEAHSVSTNIPTLSDEGTEERLWFRRSLSHVPGPLETLTPTKKTSMPTLRRGWIFQERLLATRVLHFGPQELIWECLQLSTCQCTVNQSATPTTTAAPALSSISWGNWAFQLKSGFNIQNWTSWNERELGLCWHKLIEQYTKLQLSHEGDIFPAFSGVAKTFQQASKSTYLAGLWRKTLLNDLLWHVTERDEVKGDNATSSSSHGRPARWRAPTWSWGSVSSPVVFLDTSGALEPCCDVIETESKPCDGDPTGKVASGFVELRGKLIPTALTYERNSEPPKPWNTFSLAITKGRMCNTWADVDPLSTSYDFLPEGSEVYCFPIGVRTVSRAIECLIIKESSQQNLEHGKVYERIGLLEMQRGPRDDLDEWAAVDNRIHSIRLI